MRVVPPVEQTSRFTHVSCPECGGVLEPTREADDAPPGYVCRVGHRYTPLEMLVGKEATIERLLWTSLRAVDELIAALHMLQPRRTHEEWPREWRAREEIAMRQRQALEGLIAENEPIDLRSERESRTAALAALLSGRDPFRGSGPAGGEGV
jgi:hypothetical protein